MTNMRRLAVHAMSVAAVPAGGGFADAIKFLTNKTVLVESARQADKFARDAVAAVRAASDPNPWRDADDEAIAGEILRRIDERKRSRA